MKRHLTPFALAGYLFLLLVGGAGFVAMFTGCASHRPPVAGTPPPVSAMSGVSDPARKSDTLQVDSVVVQPHRSLLDKILGRTPSTKSIKSGQLHQLNDINVRQLPAHIGKKSTVSIYYAPATVNTAGKNAVAGTGATGVVKPDAPVALGTGAVAVEKMKAPVGTGAGNVTDQSGSGAASTIDGNNNAPVVTAPAPVNFFDRVLWGLAQPLGLLVAAVVVGLVVWGLLAWRRRKEDTA